MNNKRKALVIIILGIVVTVASCDFLMNIGRYICNSLPISVCMLKILSLPPGAKRNV